MNEWICVSNKNPPKDKPFWAFVYDQTYKDLTIFYAEADDANPEHFVGYTFQSDIVLIRKLGIGIDYVYQIIKWMPVPYFPKKDEFSEKMHDCLKEFSKCYADNLSKKFGIK